MRTYGQYCAVAKALDLVGDRWTILIVRELLLQGPCRYTDLRNGLPGVATNLLADRLRELERAGLIESEAAPPPVATTLFSLTERGRGLAPALRELGIWGAALMPAGPAEQDAFRGHWLAFPASLYLRAQPGQAPVTLELRAGEETVTVEAADGALRVRPGGAPPPDLVLSGSPEVLLGAISGVLPFEEGKALGLEVDGDLDALRRLQQAAREPGVHSQADTLGR
jgi:DNA-binding HxlR family transcriptional regulator